jgi:hypothetical protein
MALVAFEGKKIDVPEKFSPSLEFVRYHREIAAQLSS